MRHFLSLLMLVVYVAAWECIANATPGMNPQMAEIAASTATTTTEEPTTSTEEPSTSTEEPTTSTEEPTTSTEEPTTSTEVPTTLTDGTAESSVPSMVATNTGTQISTKVAGSNSAGGTLTGGLLTQKNVPEKVVAAVKSLENKDDSRIGCATSFSFAAVVTLGMLAVGPA